MRAEFKDYGQIAINPEDFSLSMTPRQENLLRQMMTKQEEADPEQVKKAENVLSWINKNYDVDEVEEQDGTHRAELKTGKSNVKEDLFIRLAKTPQNKFQAAVSKVRTIQNLAKAGSANISEPKGIPQERELPNTKENQKEILSKIEIQNPNKTVQFPNPNSPPSAETEEDKPNFVESNQSLMVPAEMKNEDSKFETTLRKSPKTQTADEPDFLEIKDKLKSLCIMESPWETFRKVWWTKILIWLKNVQEKVLGEGAVGLVTLALHKSTKEKVAIKQIDLQESEDILELGVNKKHSWYFMQ